MRVANHQNTHILELAHTSLHLVGLLDELVDGEGGVEGIIVPCPTQLFRILFVQQPGECQRPTAQSSHLLSAKTLDAKQD